MNKSSSSPMRGIFLLVAVLFSIALLSSNVYGQQVSVSGTALEETTVVKLTNDSTKEVDTLKIWLGADFNFQSFKTENGWVGEKNSQGVIVFTSSESIKPGESVKFGIKTNKPNPGINWKALDDKNVIISNGLYIAKEILPPPSPPPVVVDEKPKVEEPQNSMTDKSVFRIVPEKPNVGSSIRVTGDNFGTLQEFTFYIDSQKIGTFETDKNGHFMTTMKIPDEQTADRVDLKIIADDGEEIKKSIKIGEVESRIAPEKVPLTINGMSNIVYRGDLLELSGTGDPNSAITADITIPDGDIINTRTAEIDSKGNWKVAESILVALDAPFGKYSAVISDGRESLEVHWEVETNKKIIMSPITLKFEQGETMKFNGTAIPNKSIEFILNDPLGNEIVSDIKAIDDTGNAEFEFPTTRNTLEGTYTLIAIQGKEKEFIYAGVGQLPIIPVNLKFDKPHYKGGDTAVITLLGEASEIISLLILDPSDKPVGESTSITLQANGHNTHSIELTGFASGIYTVIVSKGSAQSEEVFTVGLGTGAKNIEIVTTKTKYYPGDPILILGETDENPNVLLTITMTDPNGNVIKTKETFSDKNAKVSESSFRIPSEATPGLWTINARSGTNFQNIEIEVLGTIEDGMIISVEHNPKLDGVNDFVTIHIIGALNKVQVEIIAKDGKVIGSVGGVSSKEGIFDQPWKIPKDTEPGTYTIRVDSLNSTDTTFDIP